MTAMHSSQSFRPDRPRASAARLYHVAVGHIVHRTVRLGAAAMLVAMVSAALTASASRAEVTWHLATEYPRSNISGVGLETFGKNLAKRTRGAVVTDTAYDNALKIPSGVMLQAAQDHRIDGGDAFAGPLESSDPIFGLPSLPFVVQSAEAAKTVNAKARPLYEKALAARGLKLLYLTIWPATGIWSDHRLATTDDLRALAIRTYDANSAEVMTSVGAKAVSLPFNDAIALVKDHKLTAILTSGDGGAGRKLWDDLRDFSPINYASPISIAFVRQDQFDALPRDVQAEVLAAAADTEASQFALLATRTTENYASMRGHGVSIDEPTPEPVMAALKQGAAAPIAAWRAKVSPEAGAVLDSAQSR